MSRSIYLDLQHIVLDFVVVSMNFINLAGPLSLSLQGTAIDNDGFVDVDDIGSSSNPDNRLLCQTTDINCCAQPNPAGIWLLPDGTAPPTTNSPAGLAGGFSRDRGPSVVRLYRRANAPERGRFECEIGTDTIYVNICE